MHGQPDDSKTADVSQSFNAIIINALASDDINVIKLYCKLFHQYTADVHTRPIDELV